MVSRGAVAFPRRGKKACLFRATGLWLNGCWINYLIVLPVSSAVKASLPDMCFDTKRKVSGSIDSGQWLLQDQVNNEQVFTSWYFNPHLHCGEPVPLS